jgi:regulatory protein
VEGSGVLGTDDQRLQRALELCYRYLNRCDRTVNEIRRYLEQKNIEAETAERTIETLTGQGYLDDVRFARQFVADKRELEQWGTERIRRGLLSHGIDHQEAEAALEQQPVSGEVGETELDRALALLRVRFPSAPRERRERDRALGVLLRKGYESDLALDALTAYARGN